MRASDVQTYLRSLNGGWVNPEKTVDTFKSGDPEAEVSGIAVSWMSTMAALRQALALDCNVFITHEPTYYNHLDNQDPRDLVWALPGVREKRDFIAAHDLVVLRCHDLWDQIPGIGIPDAWGAALGLDKAVAGEGYYRVYDVAGRTAGDVARQVAARTAAFGQEAVQLFGNPETPVTRVAIGTGAITPLFVWVQEYGIDLAICTDDGFTTWQHGAYALDQGLPVIVVNHATSEEPGMIALAHHLQVRFPEVPVHYIPRGCLYRVIQAET